MFSLFSINELILMKALLDLIFNSKNQHSLHQSKTMMTHLAVLIGRASQTRFKSEQSIAAALGMLLYFIYFCPYYTHKFNKQMDGSYGNESEAMLANKEFNLGLFG